MTAIEGILEKRGISIHARQRNPTEKRRDGGYIYIMLKK